MDGYPQSPQSVTAGVHWTKNISTVIDHVIIKQTLVQCQYGPSQCERGAVGEITGVMDTHNSANKGHQLFYFAKHIICSFPVFND